jgi:aconitate hydratase
MLLGVRAVIAQSFERIHRSNLVGMGVLPCQFEDNASPGSLNLDGSEVFDLTGIERELKPRQKVQLTIHRSNGKIESAPLILRIDSPIEVEYFRNGGILPYVLRQLLANPAQYY